MEGSWTRCFKRDYADRDCDTLLTYLGFSETFKIHTDARAFQLGTVISQKGKPIAFYSGKITDDQQQDTVT